jgi:hypothetical protein
MCKYKRGDVVWGWALFSDGIGVKPRPLIVLKVNEDLCKYFLVECSSLKDKHYKMKGVIIKEDHAEYGNLGFDENTFINFSNRCWLFERLLKSPPDREENPVGFCLFVDDLEKRMTE